MRTSWPETWADPVTFRYFAYGSNLWPPRMRSRCPSALVVATAVLDGWRAVYDKPSRDGSAKLNIRPDPVGSVQGVVYRISDKERGVLDAAEPGYQPVIVELDAVPTLTYAFQGEPHPDSPYDWYVDLVVRGARHHDLDWESLAVPASRDTSNRFWV